MGADKEYIHLHLDHLQGLGFFRPLFRPGAEVHIWGPASPVQSLADRIATYLSPPLFPVRLADVPAQVTFHDAPKEAVTIGSATMRRSRPSSRPCAGKGTFSRHASRPNVDARQ